MLGAASRSTGAAAAALQQRDGGAASAYGAAGRSSGAATTPLLLRTRGASAARRASSSTTRSMAARVHAARHGGGGGEPQPVMVNDHTLWLRGAGAARPVLFGDSYVLFPPPAAAAATTSAAADTNANAGATGLVPWGRRGGAGTVGGLSVLPVPFGAAPFAGVALVVVPAAGETGIVPFGSAAADAGACIDAEARPALGAADDLPPWTTAIVRRAPTGIVAPAAGQQGDQEGEAQGQQEGSGGVYEAFNSASPRRGHKVRFTCRRCGATSIRPVSLHAFRAGSVFARCGRCHVTHKLVDNLKLFHEMAGNVFEPPAPPLPPGSAAARRLPPELQLRLDELRTTGAGGDGTDSNGTGGGNDARVGGFEGWRLWSPGLNGGEPPADGSA